MKTYRKEEQWVDLLESITCDKCGKVVEDVFEVQEAVSLVIHCGYGSKTWGDLSKVECDLCEQCIYEMIAPYARVSGYGPLA